MKIIFNPKFKSEKQEVNCFLSLRDGLQIPRTPVHHCENFFKKISKSGNGFKKNTTNRQVETEKPSALKAARERVGEFKI
ncbi:hypothetical protein GCM10009122_34440 [Fulvivirga kasyanovii]|uniref:Uncharacterized protein n=1 Tax=Fulvivirga kasyanovii TaxID=396812 RepID=A0ABW9RRD3_9BACT|nr:hypothetical protein [Fulvivirga kasyanovii]MTI25848.1 hypothetical protein [Fulvivirga kasyanovii]